jgi:hypothetical protein
MFFGALLGGALVLHVGTAATLAAAVVILIAVFGAAALLSR